MEFRASVIAAGRLLQAALWLILLGGAAAAAAYFLLAEKGVAPVAGNYYAYQLGWEHGLCIGAPFAGEADFVSALENQGFTLSRKMLTDDFEFISPGRVYLFRVKTHQGKVSALYHYLLNGVPRPENRVNFLGDSAAEIEKALGEPTMIVPDPVLRYLYELEDADLSVMFGKSGWAVETVLQRPVRRSPSQ